MIKTSKMHHQKYIRAIFVVCVGCMFIFLSGIVTLSSANEKAVFKISQIRHLNAPKIRSDLLSLRNRHRSLKPSSKEKKMGPGLKQYIPRKGPGKALYQKEPGVVDEKNMVRLILKTSDMTDDFSYRLSLYGARILKKQSGLVIAEVPVSKAEEMITEVEEIEYARKPFTFFPLGEVSEGVHLTETDVFHNNDFIGSGVKVAVIDVGFKGLSEAHLNGDIPYNVKTHDYTGMGLETKYFHGTACAEIIHDMAPNAELHLLKIYDEVDEYNAHDYCLDNGIEIISLSIGTFGTGPGDGTGPLDEAYDELRQNGILTVSSAGNKAVHDRGDVSIGGHWKGAFHDSDNDDIHEFIPWDLDSFFNIITAYPDQDDDGNPLTNEVTVLMRWNDWPNADVDYDMFLYEIDDESGEISAEPIAYSNAIQDGSQEPVEIIVEDIPDSEDYLHYYALMIQKPSEEPSGIELELYLGGRSYFITFYPYSSPIATSSSSITEPADAQSVFAVGAIDYLDWLTGPQEGFSSQGPTNAWAGSSAHIKPDIMGPDGVSGYSYGDSSFFGTSAATPHVSGAAALISEADPGLTPDELQSVIESSAIDMGPAGKDNQYGWGRMNMIFPIPNNYPDPDQDDDGMPDQWETARGLNPALDDTLDDPDNDGYANLDEFQAGTDPKDADSDDDGISDGDEDANNNQIQDPGETHALKADTDGDGILDGTESGITVLVEAPIPFLGTDANIFVPDADPASVTDPLNTDTDNDGISDGDEDINHNGSVDSGESDPNDPLSPNTGANPAENNNIGGDGGGSSGGCFISTTALDSLM